jgi:hypothetical protein
MPKSSVALADLLPPPRSHSPLEEDGRCEAHKDPDWWPETYPKWGHEPRVWRVRAGMTIRATRHKRGEDADRRIDPGTRLRLDFHREQGFRDGYFGESGDYTITERRFCVLDGQWAGTCWSSLIVADMWDRSLTDAPDPVEPIPTVVAPTEPMPTVIVVPADE